jgi:hypothetical protein
MVRMHRFGVYASVSTIRKLAEQVRWRWFLPLGMIAHVHATPTTN